MRLWTMRIVCIHVRLQIVAALEEFSAYLAGAARILWPCHHPSLTTQFGGARYCCSRMRSPMVMSHRRLLIRNIVETRCYGRAVNGLLRLASLMRR